jgi:serine protease Do
VTTHDGSQYPAEWVGSEPNVDVAVLKIKAPEGATLPKFRPLGFGDSEKVRVGEMVMAVGNPFGLSESVTRGIISAKQRELSDAANEYFQVDAVINPGNSGGPLVNVRGEIIGINVAIFTGQQNVQVWQGIGLAIPANEVREVFEAIVLGRPLIRGYFGLELENISRNYALAVGLRSLNGAVITSVVEGSPAEAASLLPGDVITKLDGKAMQSAEDTLSRIRLMKSDETAKVTIIRKGKPMETEVTAMAKSDTNTLRLKSDILTTGQSIVDAIGIKVRDLTARERNSMGVGPDYPAILVSEVVEGSQAERRFREGDLIHQINRSRVNDIASFYDLMGSLPTDSATVITLSRQGKIIQAILK